MIKAILCAFAIVLSLQAQALECRSLFSRGRIKEVVGRGFEGVVYRNAVTGRATKVFDHRISFVDTLKLQELLSEILKDAGFKVPEVYSINLKKMSIEREFIEGDPFALVEREMSSRLDRRDDWPLIANKYEAIYNRVMRRLEDDKRFEFIPQRPSNSNIPIIGGFLIYKDQEYHVHIHEYNMLISFDQKTNSPIFSVIDFR